MVYQQRKIHDFEESLMFGLKGENLFKNTHGDIFINKLNHILFDTNRNKQLSGIDFEFESRKIKFDLKTRRYFAYKYNDILIETISVIEKNKPGWFYTSQSDIIVYIWFNEKEDSIIDGYIVDLLQTRKWLKDNENKFEVKIAHTNSQYGNYSTKNICIPIKNFPANCLDKIKGLNS